MYKQLLTEMLSGWQDMLLTIIKREKQNKKGFLPEKNNFFLFIYFF